MDVCTGSINGFVLSLVRKSCKKSISEIVKESTGCTRLSQGTRDPVRSEKKVVFMFEWW